MRILRAAALLTILPGAVAAPAAHSRHSRSWKLESVQTRTESIPADGARRIHIDNLHGDVHLTAYEGREVKLTITETLRALDQEAADLARREATLSVSREGSEVVICADGPFRDPDDCTEWSRRRGDDRDYQVSYDLEIQAPREMEIKLRTVDGDIDVSGVRGRFDVVGVNGSVALSGVRGSGDARSVNGAVKVAFDENPAEDCVFNTVNGNIEVTFREGLSADLSFQTMNGEVLTDFDYQLLPPATERIETSRGGTKFRLRTGSGIRIASGGPKFEFENINGDILVRRNP